MLQKETPGSRLIDVVSAPDRGMYLAPQPRWRRRSDTTLSFYSFFHSSRVVTLAGSLSKNILRTLLIYCRETIKQRPTTTVAIPSVYKTLVQQR